MVPPLASSFGSSGACEWALRPERGPASARTGRGELRAGLGGFAVPRDPWWASPIPSRWFASG